NFPMTLIGQGPDKCWGYVGTYNYRADVSSIIIGNGTYTISGLPTNPPTLTDDTDGATLFIIFTDPSQTYTGHFIIADGCIEGSSIMTTSISGFNVCGATNSETNFAIVSDLQQIADVPFKMNSAVDNYTLPIASQNVWNYVSTGVAAATSGQTSATFGITTSGDCWNFAVAGMYYRTSCLSCTAGPCVVLPTELTKFEAFYENNNALIKWETSTEKNSKSFSILRSEDGNTYDFVTMVPGSGNSETTKQYSCIDKTVESGKTYYYKLKQTDYDKTENYVGKTIYLSCEKKNYQLDVFPNPSSNEVYIISEADLQNVNISICDNFGQKIKTLNNVNLKRNEKFVVDITNVINGCYQLTVSGAETIIQKKIVTYK
ncbi:MAG TPA: T9SS type A sorting domain-containing protein, partial [Bacteroidia bacterium]|nr:T9SS type A sorting domain-containing protein [Bacteroidia bacterium]